MLCAAAALGGFRFFCEMLVRDPTPLRHSTPSSRHPTLACFQVLRFWSATTLSAVNLSAHSLIILLAIPIFGTQLTPSLAVGTALTVAASAAYALATGTPVPHSSLGTCARPLAVWPLRLAGPLLGRYAWLKVSSSSSKPSFGGGSAGFGGDEAAWAAPHSAARCVGRGCCCCWPSMAALLGASQQMPVPRAEPAEGRAVGRAPRSARQPPCADEGGRRDEGSESAEADAEVYSEVAESDVSCTDPRAPLRR